MPVTGLLYQKLVLIFSYILCVTVIDDDDKYDPSGLNGVIITPLVLTVYVHLVSRYGSQNKQ